MKSGQKSTVNAHLLPKIIFYRNCSLRIDFQLLTNLANVQNFFNSTTGQKKIIQNNAADTSEKQKRHCAVLVNTLKKVTVIARPLPPTIIRKPRTSSPQSECKHAVVTQCGGSGEPHSIQTSALHYVRSHWNSHTHTVTLKLCLSDKRSHSTS